MQGRKPKLKLVTPMRDETAPADNETDAREQALERAVQSLRPRGLNAELRREWDRVARILAEPTVDRLKARYVDVIVEYCRACVRLRKLRDEFPKIDDEVTETQGRHGDQIKMHPHVGQINEAWRQWRSLVAMLGLSPADERNMLPGQGDLFDVGEQYFAR